MDVLLGIVAWSDVVTIVYCVATSKLLRRHIIHLACLQKTKLQHALVPPRLPPQVRRVRTAAHLHAWPPSNTHCKSFAGSHLTPFLSCDAASCLARYKPLTTHGSGSPLPPPSLGLAHHCHHPPNVYCWWKVLLMEGEREEEGREERENRERWAKGWYKEKVIGMYVPPRHLLT